MAKKKKPASRGGRKPDSELLDKGSPLVSVTDFAKAEGILRNTLLDWVNQKLVSVEYIGDRRFIDPSKARAQVAELKNKKLQSVSASPVMGDLNTEGLVPGEDTVPTTGMTFASAKTHKEAFAAREAELRYREKAGLVVSKADVERRAYEAGRVIRERFMAIPDRLSAALAAEPDARKVHTMLTEEIFNTLNTLAQEAPELEGKDETPSTPEAEENSGG